TWRPSLIFFSRSRRSRPTITTGPQWCPSGGCGGNGKGGVPTSLLPQAVRAGVMRMSGTPLVYCALGLLPRFFPLRSPTIDFAPLKRLSRTLAGATHSLPCFYPHSKWAAIGPVHVGVRSQAQVHHHGDGPGVAGCCHLRGDL